MGKEPKWLIELGVTSKQRSRGGEKDVLKTHEWKPKPVFNYNKNPNPNGVKLIISVRVIMMVG